MRGGSLAGLSPEEIAQIRSYEIGGERTRQQSVESMIQAKLGLSREQLDAARVTLLRAQEDRNRRLLEPEIASRKATAEAQIAQTKLRELELRLETENAPLKRQQLQQQIAAEEALIAQRGASTALERERLRQAAALGPEEVKRVQAQIELDKARAGDIGKARADKLAEYGRTYIPTAFPDPSAPGGVRIADIPALDIYKTLTGTDTSGDAAARLQDLKNQRERQATLDDQKRIESATEAEGIILGKSNINNPAVTTAIETHKRSADTPYYYKRNSGIFSSSYEKIPLLTKDGKPLPVRAVYQGWIEYQQKQGAISFDDYVKQFVRTK